MAEIIPLSPDQVNTCVGSVNLSCTKNHYTILFMLTVIFLPGVHAWESTCTPFKDIYKDGKDLCERMWGESFIYSTDEAKAFTMWWFGAANPNKNVVEILQLTVPDTCQVQYFHKSKPSPEADNFTECLPWKQEACCHTSVVANVTTMKKSYGAGFEWDRCGPMSSACERFFVQESCMYECEVTAGLYRKCSDDQITAAGNNSNDPCYQNTWELKGMPIKASYCDAWYDSCRNDYFCNGGDQPGNFFSCEAFYWEKATQNEKEKNEQTESSSMVWVGLGIGVGLIVSLIIGYLIRREIGKRQLRGLSVNTAEELGT